MVYSQVTSPPELKPVVVEHHPEVNSLPVRTVEQLVPEVQPDDGAKESLEPAASAWGKKKFNSQFHEHQLIYENICSQDMATEGGVDMEEDMVVRYLQFLLFENIFLIFLFHNIFRRLLSQ